MSARKNAFAAFIDVLGSAVAAAAAVNSHRQPEARDLRQLGIDPDQFRQIRDY